MPKSGAPVPLTLKAEFHELARGIVRADRAARMAGRSQNTIGAISRALEAAFKRGRDASAIVSDASIFPWEAVPPRAREALEHLGAMARLRDGENPLLLARDGSAKARPGWLVVGQETARPLVSGAIQPLIRLGLLEVVETQADRVTLSARGLAVYDSYRSRRSQGDRTLPLEGMRPSRTGG